MLTPQEVSNHAFAKAVMGGYNMAMVDEFLDELTDDYTSLYKENAALKAKMKVLVDKVEEYRSTEDAMRAALLTAQKMADSMVAEAEEKKKSLLENAESEANRKIGALRDEVAQEERRLTAAKAETADFLARVRELYEREMKLLEELPEADLAPAAPLELAKPAADVSEIEKSIMDSFKLPDLTKAAEVEPEAEEAPEEPEESPEEGNPFLDSATRAIKLSDLKFGRTVHSLIKALSRYSGIKVILIAPQELRLPDYMLAEMSENSKLEFREVETMEEVMPELDVLYMTRVQKERFLDEEEFDRVKNSFVLNPEKLGTAKKDMIILHPLPRVNEITRAVDNDSRAAYFRQVENGKFVRMALILTLLRWADRNKPFERTPVFNGEYVVNEMECSNRRCISATEDVDQLFYRTADGTCRCAYCEAKAR